MGAVYYWRRAAGRISPGGRGTFLGDQEKYPKEGRPCCLRPFALRRATCVVAFVGCAAKLSTRQGAPFGQTRQASSRCAGTLRCQRHPTNTTPQAHAKGGCEHPNSPIPVGHRYARPHKQAERSDGLRLRISPSECAEEHRVWAGQLHRRVQLLRELTYRVCLNEAPLARSEFRGAAHARAPQVARSEAKGRSQQGRPSFGYFSWPCKKSNSPAGRNPADSNKATTAVKKKENMPSAAMARVCSVPLLNAPRSTGYGLGSCTAECNCFVN